MSTTDLTGRTAIVTGASRGFGRAVATALTHHGLRVVGVARDGAALLDVQATLGDSFTPIVADVTDEALAARLIADHHPDLLVLNAGATPHAATLRNHTWATFSTNWHVDVHHVFTFARAALIAPLAPGATVISLSSGAALGGSPLSGGYAGAKATIRFINAYAASESDRAGLGIRFAALLPKLTSVTALGSTFVDAYATFNGVDRTTFQRQLGASLTPEHMGDAVLELATTADALALAYTLTADGLVALA